MPLVRAVQQNGEVVVLPGVNPFGQVHLRDHLALPEAPPPPSSNSINITAAQQSITAKHNIYKAKAQHSTASTPAAKHSNTSQQRAGQWTGQRGGAGHWGLVGWTGRLDWPQALSVWSQVFHPASLTQSRWLARACVCVQPHVETGRLAGRRFFVSRDGIGWDGMGPGEQQVTNRQPLPISSPDHTERVWYSQQQQQHTDAQIGIQPHTCVWRICRVHAR